MGIRERWQTFKSDIDEAFNPGRDGDAEQIRRLQGGIGRTAFIDDTETTPPYGTPAVVPVLEVTEEEQK